MHMYFHVYIYVYMYMQVGVLQVLVSALNMYVEDLRESSEERGTVHMYSGFHLEKLSRGGKS